MSEMHILTRLLVITVLLGDCCNIGLRPSKVLDGSLFADGGILDARFYSDCHVGVMAGARVIRYILNCPTLMRIHIIRNIIYRLYVFNGAVYYGFSSVAGVKPKAAHNRAV